MKDVQQEQLKTENCLLAVLVRICIVAWQIADAFHSYYAYMVMPACQPNNIYAIATFIVKLVDKSLLHHLCSGTCMMVLIIAIHSNHTICACMLILLIKANQTINAVVVVVVFVISFCDFPPSQNTEILHQILLQ